MDVTQELGRLLDQVLSLSGRRASFTSAAPLITCLEERYGFVIGDGDMDGNTFATFGALAASSTTS